MEESGRGKPKPRTPSQTLSPALHQSSHRVERAQEAVRSTIMVVNSHRLVVRSGLGGADSVHEAAILVHQRRTNDVFLVSGKIRIMARWVRSPCPLPAARCSLPAVCFAGANNALQRDDRGEGVILGGDAQEGAQREDGWVTLPPSAPSRCR
jgi:hypothetical protein